MSHARACFLIAALVSAWSVEAYGDAVTVDDFTTILGGEFVDLPQDFGTSASTALVTITGDPATVLGSIGPTVSTVPSDPGDGLGWSHPQTFDLILNMSQPVAAFGISFIHAGFFSATDPVRLDVYDGLDGTGSLVGTVWSSGLPPRVDFVGIWSDLPNIRSAVIPYIGHQTSADGYGVSLTPRPSSGGATRTWIGGSAGEEWFEPANWDPAGPPDPDDELIVIDGVPETVSPVSVRDGSILFDNSDPTFHAARFDVGIGGSGSVELVNDSEVATHGATFGYYPGDVGTVTVRSGSYWHNAWAGGPFEMVVGNGGDANVMVLEGSTLHSGDLTVAAEATSTARLQVSGADSEGRHGDMVIGGAGGGTLEVLDGAWVRGYTCSIGLTPGSDGNATVSGPDSLLQVYGTPSDNWVGLRHGHVAVGHDGTGRLDVNSGGRVDAEHFIVGFDGNSNGVARFRSGAMLDGNEVYVGGGLPYWAGDQLPGGGAGAGQLLAESGAFLDANFVYIGYGVGSTGQVTVDAAALAVQYEVEVGWRGDGSLTVRNGGIVSCGSARIGVNAGGAGARGTVSSALVDDADWTIAGPLSVGGGETGELEILNGGAVWCDSASIGAALTGDPNGRVLVHGQGSRLAVSTVLAVGGVYVVSPYDPSGAGRLTVSGGAQVTSAEGQIGTYEQSSGTVVVDDANWNVSGTLFVGREGEGRLEVRNGGQVTAFNALVGWGSGGDPNGTAVVDGSGSGLAVNGLLAVGGGAYGSPFPLLGTGKGLLSISNGAQVVSGEGQVGFFGGRGTALVFDANWDVAGLLTIGGAGGTGTLIATQGGEVSCDRMEIGNSPGSIGVVALTGTATRLRTGAEPMFVGYDGNGVMMVTDGAAVEAGILVVGWDGNSDGSLSADGGGVIDCGVLQIGGGALLAGGLQLGGPGVAAVRTDGNSQVLADAVSIGVSPGATGSAVVEQSVWTVDGPVDVGLFGDGSLTIGSGGQVFCDDVALASAPNSTAAVTVDGGALRPAGQLFVGKGGPATAEFRNGADVRCENTLVGWEADGNGALTVASGAFLQTGFALALGGGRYVDGNSYEGGAGTGRLTVLPGGEVKCGEGQVGYSPGSTGEAIVDGGHWDVVGLAVVGMDGTGQAMVTGGGTFECGGMVIGHEIDGNGTVRVEGEGSALRVGLALTVGQDGAGRLEIADGGVVTCSAAGVSRGGPVGETTVDGPNSSLYADVELKLGYLAHVTMTDGTIESGDLVLLGLGSTMDINGGTLIACRIQNAGGELNTAPGSVVRVNELIGFEHPIEFGGSLQIGHCGGAAVFWSFGPDESLLVGEDLTVGWGSPVVFTIDGGSVVVGGTTDIRDGSIVTLDGGLLETGSLTGAGGSLSFVSGTLRITEGGLTVGGGQPIGPSVSVGGGDLIDVAGLTTIAFDGDLVVEGGQVRSGGILNEGTLAVGTGGTATTEGGTTNRGRIEMDGGTLGGGDVLNDYGGRLSGWGAVDADLINYGTIAPTGPLDVTGTVENHFQIDLPAGSRLEAGHGVDNRGTISISGGVLAGGELTNRPCGVVRGEGSIATAALNDGLIHATGSTYVESFVSGNHVGGELRVGPAASLRIGSPWTNEGTVWLEADDSLLCGGDVTNAGLIHGRGRMASQVINAGTIRAEGGLLTLSAGLDNQPDGALQALPGSHLVVSEALPVNLGTVEAMDGATAFFTQGVDENARSILLRGGTFDNNNHPLSNNGFIGGHGTIRTGGLSNAGRVGVGGGDMDFIGPVVNQEGGEIHVEAGATAVFYGPVSGPGAYPGPGDVLYLHSFSPGASPAAVSFGGSVAFAAAAALYVELADPNNADPLSPHYDALHVAGDVALPDLLRLTWLPRPGDASSRFGGEYDVIVYGGELSGAFAEITCDFAPYIAALDYAADVGEGLRAVRITLHAQLDGDCDLDGDVDGDDLGVIEAGLNLSGAAWADGDVTFDGTVDHFDYLLWKANAGESVPGGAIPEPATLALLSLGGLLVIRLRQWRRQSPS